MIFGINTLPLVLLQNYRGNSIYVSLYLCMLVRFDLEIGMLVVLSVKSSTREITGYLLILYREHCVCDLRNISIEETCSHYGNSGKACSKASDYKHRHYLKLWCTHVYKIMGQCVFICKYFIQSQRESTSEPVLSTLRASLFPMAIRGLTYVKPPT